ncbi:MAG TPA: DUF2262 domain-containing protein [Pirellulaceae bacterium]|nr:DUF2262 domain-containing protein [Pirellulaceae bacterium]
MKQPFLAAATLTVAFVGLDDSSQSLRLMAKQNQPAARCVDSPDAIPHTDSTFVGLVDPSGGGGGIKTGRQKRWYFHAVLVAWRCNGGPVVRDPIIVADNNIADITLSNRMKQFSKWSVVKFKAKRMRRGTWQYIPVELTKFIGTTSDKSLANVIKELQQPIVINDRLFGTVNFDREAEWFEAKKFIPSEGIRITFSASKTDDVKQLICDAKPFWRARRKWFKEFQQIVYDKMFDTCASWYSDAHGSKLTKKKFSDLLGTPCSVTFYDCNGELGFELGGWSDELFGDHGVDVPGTLSGGLEP